jgi:hypothetical protein
MRDHPGAQLPNALRSVFFNLANLVDRGGFEPP